MSTVPGRPVPAGAACGGARLEGAHRARAARPPPAHGCTRRRGARPLRRSACAPRWRGRAASSRQACRATVSPLAAAPSRCGRTLSPGAALRAANRRVGTSAQTADPQTAPSATRRATPLPPPRARASPHRWGREGVRAPVSACASSATLQASLHSSRSTRSAVAQSPEMQASRSCTAASTSCVPRSGIAIDPYLRKMRNRRRGETPAAAAAGRPDVCVGGAAIILYRRAGHGGKTGPTWSPSSEGSAARRGWAAAGTRRARRLAPARRRTWRSVAARISPWVR